MLAGISKTILIKLNGDTKFYMVINLAPKTIAVRVQMENSGKKKTRKYPRKYPPSINEFLPCLPFYMGLNSKTGSSRSVEKAVCYYTGNAIVNWRKLNFVTIVLARA